MYSKPDSNKNERKKNRKEQQIDRIVNVSLISFFFLFFLLFCIKELYPSKEFSIVIIFYRKEVYLSFTFFSYHLILFIFFSVLFLHFRSFIFIQLFFSFVCEKSIVSSQTKKKIEEAYPKMKIFHSHSNVNVTSCLRTYIEASILYM